MDEFNPFAIESPSLSTLLEEVWKELAASADHPVRDWGLPVLATQGDGTPAQRIVVLRALNPEQRTVFAWTDLRSAKIEHLRRSPQASWLFYHRAWRVQVSLSGPIEILADGEPADSHWERCRPESRAGYGVPMRPGAVVAQPDAITEEALLKTPLTAGRENFAVLRGVVDEIDLFLIRRPANLRCRWVWRDGTYQGDWLVP